MQVRMFLVLVLFNMSVVVNQGSGDGKKAFGMVELKAGIQQLCSISMAILLVPEGEPGVKMVELDD